MMSEWESHESFLWHDVGGVNRVFVRGIIDQFFLDGGLRSTWLLAFNFGHPRVEKTNLFGSIE